MMKNAKTITLVSTILLASVILLAAQNVALVKAQNPSDAIVDVIASVGGTTSPAPGTYNYANGTTITLTAIPDSGFTFQYWVIAGNSTPGHAGSPYPFIVSPLNPEAGTYPFPLGQLTAMDSLVSAANPLNVICGYGYEFQYQAVFTPSSTYVPPPTLNATGSDAIVTVLPAVGGITNPTPGTYSYANGTTINLSATPSIGYQFQYWVISGAFTPGHVSPTPFSYTNDTGIFPILPIPSGLDSLVATTNPLNVICGYGYAFTYQPVFTATGATIVGPTPTPGTGPFPVVATPTPVATTPTPVSTATATPSASPSGGINWSDPVTIAIIVVVIIIIVIAIAAVAMRRKKK